MRASPGVQMCPGSRCWRCWRWGEGLTTGRWLACPLSRTQTQRNSENRILGTGACLHRWRLCLRWSACAPSLAGRSLVCATCPCARAGPRPATLRVHLTLPGPGRALPRDRGSGCCIRAAPASGASRCPRHSCATCGSARVSEAPQSRRVRASMLFMPKPDANVPAAMGGGGLHDVARVEGDQRVHLVPVAVCTSAGSALERGAEAHRDVGHADRRRPLALLGGGAPGARLRRPGHTHTPRTLEFQPACVHCRHRYMRAGAGAVLASSRAITGMARSGRGSRSAPASRTPCSPCPSLHVGAASWMPQARAARAAGRRCQRPAAGAAPATRPCRRVCAWERRGVDFPSCDPCF